MAAATFVVDFVGAPQRCLDALDLELAGGDLAGRLALDRAPASGIAVAVEHARKTGAALFMGWAWLQPRQTSPRGQW